MRPDRAVIRWRPLEGGGLEHAEIGHDAAGIRIVSTLITETAGYFYRLSLDPDWVFRAIAIQRADGAEWHLQSDGRGGWRDAAGARPDLAGCIDIDLSGSPLTNTLPIRRLRLEPDQPQALTMAWIDLDALTVRPHDQIYTRLADGRVRYANADGSFIADLTVDADGFVIDYPTLFCRV